MRFLTRPGCHLCDSARPVVARAARRVGATVEEVDIEGDDQLFTRFDLRIPVLLGPGDRVVAEGVIDDGRAVVEALRRLKRSRG
ncbi:MAG: glutaredoxin family protein [Actinobacteria bacterium]|nr:glutaredoxin family protein [Actinomycetota bacterium]